MEVQTFREGNEVKHPMPRQKETSFRKRTLSEKAYAAIKREILQGKIEEGTFLSEADVRARHQIGRTPFREACNRLHHEGILEVVPRRGYLVPEMSFRDVRDMFDARLLLEGVIAEIAATRATQNQIRELEQIAREDPPSGDSDNDYEALSRSNTEFHLCLARMTQNRELVKLVTGILERNERLAYLELRSSRIQSTEVQLCHMPVVEAIRRRDPAAAREAVLNDIKKGKLDIFGSDESPKAAPALSKRSSR
jgi:DNA-binding GntR family transcriptional regulator